MIKTSYPPELLKALETMEIKETFVRVELLNWQEETIKEIQGLITQGNLNYDGKSSLRRTCNFTFVFPTEYDNYQIEEIINLNKKFRLFIGYKNRLTDFKDQGEILWFKLGIYVFKTSSITNNLNGTTIINVTAQDKMCLLNGGVQGIIPDSIVMHEDADFNPVLMYTMIVELVNHYGEEPLQNIFINDIPDYGRLLMQYMGSQPIYLSKDPQGNYNGNISFSPPAGGYEKFVAGQTIGYSMTELTFPGEFITNVGDSITGVLDKIVDILGNYEYFYDIDGNFIFQEIRNYLNTSYVPIEKLDDDSYQANFSIADTVYSFNNTNLISSYSNAPRWDNIKNDFVVWGVKKSSTTGIEVPIRYHLAIDDHPLPEVGQEDLDYRELIYLRDKEGNSPSYYYKEMQTKYTIDGVETDEWRRLYDGSDWTDTVKNNPKDLNYFLDFVDGAGDYAKYSVSNIGRRTVAKQDNNAVCVYSNNPPAIVFVSDTNEYDKYTALGYTCSVITPQLQQALIVSGEGKSCFEVIRELFYQHVSLQDSITLSSIPIYYLEPNDKIEVEDEKSNIHGKYMISSISMPLAYNGNMSISAYRAETRI